MLLKHPNPSMNQDLKSRIPAAIAYVLIIGIATLMSPISTMVLLYAFALLSLFEFVKSSMGNQNGALIYIMGLFIAILALPFLGLDISMLISYVVYVSVLLFAINIGFIIFNKKTFFTGRPVIIMALIYIVLPFLIASFMTLTYEDFPRIILGTFVIVWLNDAGAYFSGKAFGKTKLSPSISPNKTWEGLIGGGILGVLICIAIAELIGGLSLSHWMILSVVVWITGSMGDLVESSWKRQLGLKDSGSLMGGHGGFLDRLDSFIYAIPFVSLYYIIIQ